MAPSFSTVYTLLPGFAPFVMVTRVLPLTVTLSPGLIPICRAPATGIRTRVREPVFAVKSAAIAVSLWLNPIYLLYLQIVKDGKTVWRENGRNSPEVLQFSLLSDLLSDCVNVLHPRSLRKGTACPTLPLVRT